jgi:hypothetical protein
MGTVHPDLTFNGLHGVISQKTELFKIKHDSMNEHVPCIGKVKKKAKLPLCLFNEALCHEDIRESGGIAPPFLTSALGGPCIGEITNA